MALIQGSFSQIIHLTLIYHSEILLVVGVMVVVAVAAAAAAARAGVVAVVVVESNPSPSTNRPSRLIRQSVLVVVAASKPFTFCSLATDHLSAVLPWFFVTLP